MRWEHIIPSSPKHIRGQILLATCERLAPFPSSKRNLSCQILVATITVQVSSEERKRVVEI